MKPTITVDSRGFTGMSHALSKATGKPLHEVIDSEAGAVLTTCAKRTKVAKKGNVARSAFRQGVLRAGAMRLDHGNNDFVVTIGWRDQSKRGEMFFKPDHGKLFYVGKVTKRSVRFGKPNRLSANLKSGAKAIASRIQKTATTSAETLEARRGLAVSSWIDAARSANLKLGAIPASKRQAARNAKGPKSGISHQNGRVVRMDTGLNYHLKIENTLPYNTKIKMDSQLKAAIAGRRGYFRRNLEHGVFESTRDVARAYPGLRVTP